MGRKRQGRNGQTNAEYSTAHSFFTTTSHTPHTPATHVEPEIATDLRQLRRVMVSHGSLDLVHRSGLQLAVVCAHDMTGRMPYWSNSICTSVGLTLSVQTTKV
jgi:hypothetical protein